MFAGNERLYLNSYVNQHHFLMHPMPAMVPSPIQEQDEPISLVVRESKPSPRQRSTPIEDEIATAVRPLPFHPSYPSISPVFASRLQLPATVPLPLQLPPILQQSQTVRAGENDFTADKLLLQAKLNSSSSSSSSLSPPSTTTVNWSCAIKNLIDKQQTPDSSCVSRDSRSISPPESCASSRNSPSTTHTQLSRPTATAASQSHRPLHQNRHRRKTVSPEEKSTTEYQEKRMRNNIAAKKSRDKRRLEEKMMQLLNAYLKNKLDLLEDVTERCSACKSRRDIEYGKLPEPDYDKLLRKFAME